jgi:hypothetical protein
MRSQLFTVLALSALVVSCSKASSSTTATASPSASAAGSASAQAAEPELKSLTLDEVDARIARHDGKTFIYDNNSKDRYASGHVPTARWVDFKNVTAADLPPDRSATLVFYCGGRS